MSSVPLVLSLFAAPVDTPSHPDEVTLAVSFASRSSLQIDLPAPDFFGGRPAEVKLRLSGAPGRIVDIRARLFQLSSTLAAPIGDAVAVRDGVSIGESSGVEVPFPFTVPKTARPAQFEWRFYLRPNAQDDWPMAGSARFEAYPDDCLAPLKPNSLWVSDPEGRLRKLIEAQGIAVTELPATLEPGSISGKLQAGERDASDLHRRLALVVLGTLESDPNTPDDRETRVAEYLRAGFDVVVLHERAARLPKVVVRTIGRCVRVDVDMELVQALGESPRAQLTLLECIKLTRPEAAPDGHNP